MGTGLKRKLLRGCLIASAIGVFLLLMAAGAGYYFYNRISGSLQEIEGALPSQSQLEQALEARNEALSQAAGPLSTTPTPGAATEAAPPPQPTPTLAEQMIATRAQIDLLAKDIRQARRGGPAQAVSLEVSQDALNAIIAQELPKITQQIQLPIALEDLKVTIKQDRIVAVAKLNMFGFDPEVNMEIAISLDGGQPKIVVEKLDMSGFPFSSVVKDQVNQYIEQQIAQLPQKLPLDYSQLRIEPGRLYFEGSTIPKQQ